MLTYDAVLRRLDRWPAWLAWAMGMGLGLLVAVVVLAWAPVWLGAALFVLLLGGAVGLAWSGEPVAVLVQKPEPELPDLEMVPIRGAVFRMGSPESEPGRYRNEGPVHEVRVSAFAMMRVPVTRRLYQEIMQLEPPIAEADERPMTGVSWLDAIRFCNRLSERQGMTPCYRVDENNNVQWEPQAAGYRLPTEAEWEYACRAGTQSRFFFGEDDSLLGLARSIFVVPGVIP